MRIRQGNDFIFLWAIERNELPEDFSNAVNIRLHFKNFDCIGEVKSFQIVDGNIVRVEVSPEWASKLGAYRLILSYEFEDLSYSDGDRKCVVDVLAFNIVPKTSEADDVTEMAKTTDIMIGLQGLSAYDVWLKDNPESTKEDYYNWLRQPATDAVSLIEDKIETLDTAIQQEEQRELAEGVRLSNEQSRVEAEGLRVSGEVARNTAEGIRVSSENMRANNEGARILAEEDRIDAEETRVENETLRISAELLREGAESDREDAEQLRQTNTSTAIQNANEATQSANNAAELANTKAENANTSAQNADEARLAIQDDLALKADQADLVQLESDVEQLAYVKIKNEAVNGNFENGLRAPFSRTDGIGGAATLDINSSTPISGNYDIRLTIITPSISELRPFFHGLDIAGNIGDKIYLHFYAKILSGIPMIGAISDGARASSIYGGNVINGRNTRIIDVVGTSINVGLIYFDSRSAWDMQMDNFMRINLTETFGAGNEPTKEEMDLLISTLGIDYFEGEIPIPAQKVMQWLAIQTDLGKPQVVVDYTHTGNKEVNIESIDFATGTITSTGHGLAVNNVVYLINKGMGNFPFSAIPTGINPFVLYRAVNITPNTFQLALDVDVAPITLSDKATKDYSKWHLEIAGNAIISGLSLRKFTVEFEGKSSMPQGASDYFYLAGGKDYGTASPVWFTDTENGKITSGLNRSIFKSMANGDIWSYNRLDVDVTGKLASILINGYRIYSLTETTVGIIRHNNEVAVHSSAGEDVVTGFTQLGIFNGMNIKVTKIL